MRLFLKLFLTFQLLLGASQAHALPVTLLQVMSALVATDNTPAATSETAAFFTNLERIASIAQSKFNAAVTDSLFSEGMNIGMGLVPISLAIGGSLALLYFVYQIVMTMGERSNSSMINALFETLIPFVVAAMLLKGYAMHMDNFRSFLNIFSTVGTDPLTGVTNFYGGALVMLKQAIILGYKNVIAAKGIGPTVMAGFDLAGVILVAAPVLFFVVMGIAEVFGILLLGPFLQAIGAAFGPIFIAFFVMPWTKTFLSTWAHFMIGSALVTGVARVTLQLASAVFGNLDVNSLSSDTPVAASLLLVLVMLAAVNSVISMIPGIASAMVPGNIGARSPASGMIAAGKQAAKSNPVGGAPASIARGTTRAATKPFRMAGNAIAGKWSRAIQDLKAPKGP